MDKKMSLWKDVDAETPMIGWITVCEVVGEVVENTEEVGLVDIG
jgi:hypothetical protein